MKIVLASESPRRAYLLKKIIRDFVICPSRIDETKIKEKDPVKFASLTANLKAKAVGEKFPEAVIIGADTIVVLGGAIFTKPRDRKEAREMLNRLSANRHRVITAFSLYQKKSKKLLSGYEITHVSFRELTAKDIEDYLDRGGFKDKAGSYAIQDIKDKFVKKIEGDYDNVVGLPLTKLKKTLEAFEGAEAILTITDIAFPGGFGVAKKEKLAVFVPKAVLGDKVIVKDINRSRRFSVAQNFEVVELSPFRVKPKCPHSGVCEGCTMQELDYNQQLRLKKGYLARVLFSIGKIKSGKLKRLKIYGSTPYFYRNKMEFSFGRNAAGKVIIGLKEKSRPFKKYTPQITPIGECPVFSPSVNALLPLFLEFASDNKISIFNPSTGKGVLRSLVLREAKSTGELMVSLVARGSRIEFLDKLADRLFKKIPNLKSFWHLIEETPYLPAKFKNQVLIGGRSFIDENIADFKFRIYPTSFFQPNTEAAYNLYLKISRLLDADKKNTGLGLYCGSGALEIFVSASVKEIHGIDSDTSSIAAARENLRLNNIINCFFYDGKVEDVLAKANFKNPDFIIVDPPRAGLSLESFNLIVNLKANRLIYVSCNPATLARDIRNFVEAGWKLKTIEGFDFFPHTGHVEVLAVLTR